MNFYHNLENKHIACYKDTSSFSDFFSVKEAETQIQFFFFKKSSINLNDGMEIWHREN